MLTQLPGSLLPTLPSMTVIAMDTIQCSSQPKNAPYDRDLFNLEMIQNRIKTPLVTLIVSIGIFISLPHPGLPWSKALLGTGWPTSFSSIARLLSGCCQYLTPLTKENA